MQKFKHIMKELQGAIIIGSAFQAILGYSGLMSVLVRYDFGMFYSTPRLEFIISKCLLFHLPSENC